MTGRHSDSRDPAARKNDIERQVLRARAGLQLYTDLVLPIPSYRALDGLVFRDGSYWDADVDGEVNADDRHLYQQEFLLPADGYAPLGGDQSDMVGILRLGRRVFLTRERTHSELREKGLITLEPSWSYETNEDPLWMNQSERSIPMSYHLTVHGGVPTLAVDIDEIVGQDDLARKLETRKLYPLGYPLPSFKSAVKAAKLLPKGLVVAVKVPVRLYAYDETSKEDVLESGKHWHLVHQFDPPDGRFDLTGAWITSQQAVADLIATPEAAQAIHKMDRQAWAIANQAYEYVNSGKYKRRMFGLRIAAVGLVGTSDASLDIDAGSLPGAELNETLNNVSAEDGVAAAEQAGTDYAHDIQFGKSVPVYDPGGVDKVQEVDFKSSSYGTGPTGDKFSMNQWGSVTKRS